MNDVLEEQKNFFNFISNEISKNKLSHAYLIETFDYCNTDKLILEFLKFLLCDNKIKNNNCDCKLCHLIDNNNYPDIKFIEPQGSNIKKEQLLSVMDDLKGKSIYNNKRIYVITDATRLNSSSANTMLKFLEEPEDDIIAILIANSRYKVIDTILSRCQILSLDRQESNDYSEVVIDISDIICDKNKSFLYFDELLSKIPSRIEAFDIFKEVQQYLFSNLGGNYLNLTDEKLISIISILDSIIIKLENNVNYKLILDNLLISILEVVR